MGKLREIYAFVGHHLREVLLHLDRSRLPNTQPRVIFFASSDLHDGGSSELRATNIVRALRARGWRAVIVPPQLELGQRLRVLRKENPDLIVLQQWRHSLNRPSLYQPWPVLLDIDDADFLDTRYTETISECCRQSVAVIAGSSFVANWCAQYNEAIHIVWTGSPVRIPDSFDKPSPPILAYANSSPTSCPHELETILTVVKALAAEGIVFRFRLYHGVDTLAQCRPFIEQVENKGVPVEAIPNLKYSDFLKSLDSVAVALAPLSVKDNSFANGKSFGKTLAYMSAGVATVAQNECEYPKFYRHRKNGMLASTQEEWISCTRYLLKNHAACEAIAKQAHFDYISQLSLDVVSSRVSEILQKTLTLSRRDQK